MLATTDPPPTNHSPSLGGATSWLDGVVRRAGAKKRPAKESVGLTSNSLCNLSVLCVSVVDLLRKTLTTETQRTRRLHREEPSVLFPTDSQAGDSAWI
jgi:hypothetical protein